MSMKKKMEAAAKRVAAMKAAAQAVDTKPAKPAKPAIRIHMGAALTEAMIRKALGLKTKAAEAYERWQENKVGEHKEGGICPHCQGTGRYRFHTDPHRNEKCFRCHGKGSLNARDIAFLMRRVGGAGPICPVSTAPAA